jgi:hypothetical protein
LRWLGKGVLQADRPLEALSKHLDEAEDLLDAIESALELSGLPGELWDTFEEIQTILEFSVRVRPLAERNLIGALSDVGSIAKASTRWSHSVSYSNETDEPCSAPWSRPTRWGCPFQSTWTSKLMFGGGGCVAADDARLN